MPKTISYLYPNLDNLELKVFQDKSSNIRAFYFNKNTANELVDISLSDNSSIYFLFDKYRIYVGKSKNGIYGIDDLESYEKCIMFVENNNFNDLFLDYLQNQFIYKTNKSKYDLINKEKNEEISINIYELPILNDYIEEISLLLKIEGVNLQDEVVNEKDKEYQKEEKKKEENGWEEIREGIPANKFLNHKNEVALGKSAMGRAPPKRL